MKFKSRIEGKNADVEILEDRIEWSKSGVPLNVEIVLALLTGGLSLLATRFMTNLFPQTDMIPLKSVSSVSSKAGWPFTELHVRTGTATILIRTSASQAQEAKEFIQSHIV